MERIVIKKVRKLKELFNEKKIEEIAFASKFVQRKSKKMSAVTFLELTVFDNINICSNSLESQSTHLLKKKKIKMTSQSIDERYNGHAVEFLKKIFETITKETISKEIGIETKFTSNFNRIVITDSSIAELPSNCKGRYKGSGGDASESSVKVQVSYDIKAGNIMLPDIGDVGVSDSGYLQILKKKTESRDLMINDLGYFSVKHFQEVSNKTAYYMSRLKTNTTVYIKNKTPMISKKGKIIKESEYQRVDLAKEAKLLKEKEVKEFEVYVGKLKVKTRLMMCKLPKEAIEKKLIKQAKTIRKTHVGISKITKDLTTVNIYITNIPADILPKEMSCLIYTIRWQIEILFKILKTIFLFDKIKKVKLERIQCHIYSTLIKLLLSSKIVHVIRNLIYQSEGKEISEYKSFGIVNSFFEDIKNVLFHSTAGFNRVIKKIITSIINNGMKSKKKNKKTVLEILAF